MSPVRLPLREFVDAAREVVDALPEPFQAWLENVVIDVEETPSRGLLRSLGLDPRRDTLFGLFEGHAVTDQDFGERLPNRILLFRGPILEACRSRDEVLYEIRRTVLHELAHHFGHSEEDLDDFESRPSPFDRPDEDGNTPP